MLVAGRVWGEEEFPKQQEAYLGNSRGSARVLCGGWQARAGGTNARALADVGTCSCISPASATVPGHVWVRCHLVPSIHNLPAQLRHPRHIQCPSSPEFVPGVEHVIGWSVHQSGFLLFPFCLVFFLAFPINKLLQSGAGKCLGFFLLRFRCCSTWYQCFMLLSLHFAFPPPCSSLMWSVLALGEPPQLSSLPWQCQDIQSYDFSNNLTTVNFLPSSRDQQ